MNEQTSNGQDAMDRRDAIRLKRTGQTCLTIFVVFLLSLLSFGKAPLGKTTDGAGFRINFNFISSLGVVMGIVAVLFLLVRFKRILRLPATRKVLGLTGCLGLAAHTLLALFLPLSYGGGSSEPVGTAGNPPLARSGAEEWVVDGKTYKIASTYYLHLPEGFQFTIEYPHSFSQSHGEMNDARALDIVFPLMKHAYGNGLYKRASTIPIGQGKEVTRIGVVLFEKQGGNVRGYRVALSLDQIRKRIEQDGGMVP